MKIEWFSLDNQIILKHRFKSYEYFTLNKYKT